MKKLFYILITLLLFINSYGQFYDLIVTTKNDSIACHIDSITDTHIYFEMKNQGRWIHSHSDKADIVDYKLNALDKQLFVFKESTSYIKSNKPQASTENRAGIAIYPELLGKGFYSFNVDFPIDFNHRLSVGLTWLDYSFEDYRNYYVGTEGAPTAGLMYYYLIGKRSSFLELGCGFSLYHRLGLDYKDDSPLSLHGVIGYRYQKKDGLLFRAGFTPFKRVNNWFLPLMGVSFGYSW